MKSVDPSVYRGFSLPFSAGEEEVLGMAMFSSLSPEEQQYMETQRLEMITLKQTIAGLVEAGATGFGKGGQGLGRDGDERGSALLNRKDFGLVDKFDGNQSKFESWLFDLLTALGAVDQVLASETKELLKARPEIEIDLGIC